MRIAKIIQIIIIILTLALMAGGAQTQSLDEIPLAPADEQAITQQIITDTGLADMSLPSVDIIIPTSGEIGTTALLKAGVDNININNALFEWYLDDKLQTFQSGRAKTNFAFRTAKTFHIVRLVISENGRKLTENTVSVASFNVALTWHAATFAPAEYEGKALPSVGSRVTVTAIPEIKNESPEDLLYTWYLESESQVRGAIGENEFSFMITKNVTFIPIVVEVSTQSQSITVRGAVNIPIQRPTVVLYRSLEKENDGVSSAYPAALKPGDVAYFYAKPYGFHVKSLDDLSYEWEFAGRNILGFPPDPHLLTLVIPKDSGAGSRMLNVVISNPRFLGEDAGARMEVRISL